MKSNKRKEVRKTNRKEALWWEIWNRLDTKLSKIIELLEKIQQEDLAWGGHRNVPFPSNSKFSAKDRQELADSIRKILN